MSKKNQKSKSSGSGHVFQPNEVVLAKLRGFPPWPAMVVDEEDIPSHVTKERPQAKKGSNNNFCVRFFPVGDYSFMTSKELTFLQKHEIEAYINEPHKKNGELLQGYKIALDPSSWLEEKKNEAENKASYDPAGEVDELEDEGEGEIEEGAESKKKGTKRKRDPEAKAKGKKAPGAEKVKKTPKKAAKSSEAVESEEDAKPAAPKKAKKTNESDDPEVRKVKQWRNQLQRVFLGKVLPVESEMEIHDALFKEVEAYESITLLQLTETKIGKIMRHIANLEDDKVPRDAEFKFKQRAQALVVKWQKVAKAHEDAEAAAAGASGSGAQVNGTAPQTNGAVPPTPTEAAKDTGADANGDVTMKSVEANGTEVNGTTTGDEMKVDGA